MALGRMKTEHAGAKNGDKRLRKVEVKTGSRKHRRREDRRQSKE